jgi:hypothetical protein
MEYCAMEPGRHLAARAAATDTLRVEAPEVRYAQSGDINIADSVVGEGPFDVVFIAGWVISPLELAWEARRAVRRRALRL